MPGQTPELELPYPLPGDPADFGAHMQALAEKIETAGGSAYPARLTGDVTVTVGAGGDYATINEALAALSARAPEYVSAGLAVELNLLSGFVMEEQVFVHRIDLGWITVTSVDAEVTIARSALVNGDPLAGSLKPAWLAHEHATLPTIDTIFSLDNSGVEAGSRVFRVKDDSRLIILPGAGCKGAAERLVEVTYGSILVARSAVITGGAGIGLRVSNGAIAHVSNSTISGHATNNVAIANAIFNGMDADFSDAGDSGVSVLSGPAQVHIQRSDLSGAVNRGLIVLEAGHVNFTDGVASGCGIAGIEVRGPATVSAIGADCSGAGSYGIDAQDGAQVNASNAVCTTAGTLGIRVTNGSEVVATGATGTLSQPTEVRTRAGVIYAGGQNLGANIVRSGAQSIPHAGTPTKLVLNGVRHDIGGFYNGTDGLLVPADKGGLAIITLQVNWDAAASATGIRNILIYRNGSPIASGFGSPPPTVGSWHTQTLTTAVMMAPGDTIEAWVTQTSGAAVNVRSGSNETFLALSIIGATGV